MHSLKPYPANASKNGDVFSGKSGKISNYSSMIDKVFKHCEHNGTIDKLSKKGCQCFCPWS
ncbi:hypothetical protein SO802_008930 [Lithocarpus litseifolius]|uniref:Uncharacterized protein n=1 Tax=Lithocarpus litseifolius TaxID=425828 RepID=A0AAW2DA12_9ROSI